MKSGTISFAGTDLGCYGTPKFTMRRSPSPAAPAIATHTQIDIAVSVELRAEMPATVWARVRALQTLLAGYPKALLEIHDENGLAVSYMATAGENSLPEAISRGGGRVEMNFSALQPVSEADYPLGITVDPLDGGGVITIARPLSWHDSHKITRVDGRKAIRSEIATSVTFTARTAYADPLTNAGTRAEFLMTEAARLNALAGKEGRVRFAGFDEVMQFESFSATPNDGWDFLELSAQCRRVTLPGDDEAEVKFKTTFTEDPATGETKIVVSGSIEAPDETIAHAKADAILEAYRSGGRRVAKIKKEDTWADGEDASSPEWLGINFDFELVENTSDVRYTVKIETREASDGTRTTYSGTATASSLFLLLATVEEAAGSKHPVELHAELSVEWATDDEGTVLLVSANFTREYQTATGKIRGEIRRTTSKGNFGDWTTSVSGKISAATLDTARMVARKYISTGVILRTDEENEGTPFVATVTGDPLVITTTEQFATLDFSYAWGTDHTQTSIQYTDRDAPDYTKMVGERTISGTVWAASRAEAKTQVAALLTGLSLSNPTKEEFTDSRERVNAASLIDRALSFQFSYTFEAALTGSIGHDIIEAQWSIQRIGMVDHEPMTEIPMAKPVKQVPFGYNIGRLIATGSVKARVQATALAWGQGKCTAVAAFGEFTGAADPPDERMGQTMVPFNGTDAAFHDFSFTYGFRYNDGLTGLWPSSGLTL